MKCDVHKFTLPDILNCWDHSYDIYYSKIMIIMSCDCRGAYEKCLFV